MPTGEDNIVVPPAFDGESVSKNKEIYVTFGVDVDAVAGWLGSYGGEDSPFDISRGICAAEVGVPRLLELFRRFDLKTTWFLPGHSVESFPLQMRQVVAAGHEVGAHGYSHENPVRMTPKQEEDVLALSVQILENLTGKKPKGYVAPWWELSAATPELLLRYGFKYDHSQGHHDFQPYYARTAEKWTNIDYSKPARDWMKPLDRGQSVDLVEIPANWYVDDLPPMMFIKSAPNSHGFMNPRDIEDLWRDQFEWVYREYNFAVFPITIHPDVSGRPQVLLMLERFISYIRRFPGVHWTTMEEVAQIFRNKQPFLNA
ncbi:Peptidoglycan deacetylase [Galdieria sulphuraria]|uniref:Polysaccharide deacetylase n=1 Tax=Galdieria sulphuraria TaxID=130081 RepID=M2XTZ5_GALSU|nr:polysaccharide deacetylase [Galdieria sulphuraria]EME27138.1 polysaccharide deacetylase [Galdieria sulphuraria]GJD09380.1 Peptidoglycan deacetylase [Galdieria sulphuraria]|eukprot:XP_005703658.1 polysaccharide deacetylase [Galdieria sulphuraria]